MYQNVDPKNCQSVTISDLISDAVEEGRKNETINSLYIDSKIQYVKSSW